MEKIAQEIDSIPIAAHVEEAAFERFRASGELPEHQRLAVAVVQRALGDHADRDGPRFDFARWSQRVQELLARLDDEGLSEDEQPDLRRQLLLEAVHESEAVRCPARAVIGLLVSMGRDVMSEDFVDEGVTMPGYGTLGLHLLGWPDCLMRRPYKRQARRLLERLAAVRARIVPGDERWSESCARMAAIFFRGGELPDDELMRDAVLVYGELLALARHLGNEADVELLAAFDDAAQHAGQARDFAIERLQRLAAAGRIP